MNNWTFAIAAAAALLREPASGADIKRIVEELR